MVDIEMIKHDIRMNILENNYDVAEEIFSAHRNELETYDDVWAILDASIGVFFEDEKRVWKAIKKGLSYNHKNFELYVMLGDYYLNKNPKQSYLCYENALFYCDDADDFQTVNGLLEQLEEEGISVNRVAFVILSFNSLEYTKLCINSVRATVPEYAREIIVVDNASADGSVEWLREQHDIKLLENKENMGFPIGCNQGIAIAEADTDIMLLNNDTVLTPNAIFWLRMGLYADENNGLAGSVSNNVVNYQAVAEDITNLEELMKYGEQNNVPMEYPYEEKLFLIGFALLIKRKVLEGIGVLDERFTPGNSEDIDYGLRALQTGYKNVLCYNSFIIHFGSVSFGKNRQTFKNVLAKNKEKLNEKWGMDTSYYLYPRVELVNLIKEPKEKELRILDIGCGGGATMGRIRFNYPNAKTYGIEIVPGVAELAKHMGEVFCGDVEKMEFQWPEEYFDYIILGDILEHLREPSMTLNRLYKNLKAGGHVIISMPNVKHYSVILPLLINDVFPYADSGILDRTHLKMYTGTEIANLVKNSDFEIEELYGVELGKPNDYQNNILDQLVSFMEKPNKESYLVYQYIIKAKK